MISKPIPPSIHAYDCDLDYYDACEKYEQDCEYYYNRDTREDDWDAAYEERCYQELLAKGEAK